MPALAHASSPAENGLIAFPVDVSGRPPAIGETSSRSERHERDSIILWEGDRVGSAYVIERGVVRLCRQMADGRRAILGFLFAGESLGLTAKDRYGYTAEAVTDVELRPLPIGRIHAAAAGSAEIGQRYLALISDELAAAHERLVLLGRMYAIERIAFFLLEVAQHTGARDQIELPMTRLDIADYLGLTLETVSRMISRLKNDGVIALPHPQCVRLLRRDELAQMAGREESKASASTETWPKGDLPRLAARAA